MRFKPSTLPLVTASVTRGLVAGHFAYRAVSAGSIGVQGGHGEMRARLVHKDQVRTPQVFCLLAPGGSFRFLLLACYQRLFFVSSPEPAWRA